MSRPLRLVLVALLLPLVVITWVGAVAVSGWLPTLGALAWLGSLALAWKLRPRSSSTATAAPLDPSAPSFDRF